MPIFLDRHDLTGFSASDVAEAHKRDLEIQADYGVNFITYWFDASRNSGFCLIDAPDAETAMEVHRKAHGLVGLEVIPVDLSAVEAFLGRVSDPHAAGGHGEIEPAFRTVMFTDLVDSTAMTARVGDVKSVELVRAHDSIVRRSLRDVGGREVKHTGDGIMAAFDAADAGVRCARAIQIGFETFNLASNEPLHVRIGLDAGEPVADSNDLFGKTVQKAARICAKAGSDEILISEALRALVEAEFPTEFREEATLKGISAPERIFSVLWQ
jgi:class 3 adenylate cyclase